MKDKRNFKFFILSIFLWFLVFLLALTGCVSTPSSIFPAKIIIEVSGQVEIGKTVTLKAWVFSNDNVKISAKVTWHGEGLDRYTTFTTETTPAETNFTPPYPGTFVIEASTDNGISSTIELSTENRPPLKPSNPVPANGQTGIVTPCSTCSFILAWSCSDPDGDSLVYDLYFGENEDNLSKIATALPTSTYALQEPLTPNTKYFWKVVAKDNKGGETQGDIWNFTTGNSSIISSNIYTESTYTNLSPPTNLRVENIPTWANGKVALFGEKLVWEYQKNKSDDIVFDVYLAPAYVPLEGSIYKQGLTETSCEAGSWSMKLLPNTTYHWKVVARRAQDPPSMGASSNVASFTTRNPGVFITNGISTEKDENNIWIKDTIQSPGDYDNWKRYKNDRVIKYKVVPAGDSGEITVSLKNINPDLPTYYPYPKNYPDTSEILPPLYSDEELFLNLLNIEFIPLADEDRITYNTNFPKDIPVEEDEYGKEKSFVGLWPDSHGYYIEARCVYKFEEKGTTYTEEETMTSSFFGIDAVGPLLVKVVGYDVDHSTAYVDFIFYDAGIGGTNEPNIALEYDGDPAGFNIDTEIHGETYTNSDKHPFLVAYYNYTGSNANEFGVGDQTPNFYYDDAGSLRPFKSTKWIAPYIFQVGPYKDSSTSPAKVVDYITSSGKDGEYYIRLNDIEGSTSVPFADLLGNPGVHNTKGVGDAPQGVNGVPLIVEELIE